jgi:hypothetical protein
MSCPVKTAKGNDCKAKVVDGLCIDDISYCKQHWKTLMLTAKLIEIGAMKVPDNVEPVVKVKCKSTTKKGDPCKNDSVENCDGMCKSHFNTEKKQAEKKNSPETTPSKEVREKCKATTENGNECKNYQVENCDGMCKKHHDKISKQVEKKKLVERVIGKENSPTSNVSVEELLERARTMRKAEAPPLPPTTEDNVFANIEIPTEEMV